MPGPGMTAQRVSRVLVGGLFFVSAIAKAVSPGPAQDALVFGLPWLDGHAAAFVLAGVVLTETWLALCLLLFPVSRPTLVGISALLLVFTAFLLRLVLTTGSPGCGCFGAGQLPPHTEHAVGMIRNAAMLGLVWYMWASVPARQPTPIRRRPLPAPPNSSGYTLIEMLVSIVILTILISVLLPALRSARLAGRDASALSTLRQLHVGLAGYAADQRDAFPFFATPGKPYGNLYIHDHVYRSMSGAFDDQAGLWLSVLTPEFLNPLDEDSLWADPGTQPRVRTTGEEPGHLIRSSYFLSYSVFAAKGYWDGDVPHTDLRHIRGTRWSDTTFPSSKGLIWDREGSFSMRWTSGARPLMFAAFVDGSAGVLTDTDADDKLYVSAPFTSLVGPVVSTRDGLAGRDRR
ncbi:MAG: type II secretion system protein [Planctomycetota bacterium]|nr:type II secretion system protein [Planctomycetota bacterium]